MDIRCLVVGKKVVAAMKRQGAPGNLEAICIVEGSLLLSSLRQKSDRRRYVQLRQWDYPLLVWICCALIMELA